MSQTEAVTQSTLFKLCINRAFAEELPALSDREEKDLQKSIERDGVLDPLKYWINPRTKRAELLDGHNRKRIADKLGIEYQTQEVSLNTVNEALYWMHRHQASRRGGGRNTARMSELWQKIQEERQTPVSQNEADKQVAKDAGVDPRTVRRERKAKEDVVVPIDPYDRIVRALSKISREDLERLRDWITATLANG